MANEYDKGDKVRVTGTFTDSAGTAVDPDVVRFVVRNPRGVETTYLYGTDAALVKSATGIYYVDVSADVEGKWYYRYYSTGSGQAAGEGSFTVAFGAF